jgi:hypothetical protein
LVYADNINLLGKNTERPTIKKKTEATRLLVATKGVIPVINVDKTKLCLYLFRRMKGKIKYKGRL